MTSVIYSAHVFAHRPSARTCVGGAAGARARIPTTSTENSVCCARDMNQRRRTAND
jgi:hypothetical protein